MKLRIEKVVYGGDGLGHVPATPKKNVDSQADALTGKTVFVPFTLPSELVELVITDNRRSFANARLAQVLEPSVDRVNPRCGYFGICGGCHYQHASYPAALHIKQAILAEMLTHAGIAIDTASISVVVGERWDYRNRIRLHIRYGDFALCYYETGSNRDVSVDHCPIASPLLQQCLRLFSEIAQHSGIGPGLFDEIELFTDPEDATLLLSFWTNSGPEATRALPLLCEALQDSIPQLHGAVLLHAGSNKGPGHRQAAWGNPELTYRVGDASYTVSAGSFFQVNRFLVPELIRLVVPTHQGKTAWDLYAGVGLFAQALTARFNQVIAVESAPSSVRDLRSNLHGRAHTIVASSTLEFLKIQSSTASKRPPDLVIVDPPRTGLGKDITSLLSQIGPAAITYVSCDPATLARDLQSLLHSGYHLRKVTLVDLFPQTFHLETIVELTRV